MSLKDANNAGVIYFPKTGTLPGLHLRTDDDPSKREAKLILVLRQTMTPPSISFPSMLLKTISEFTVMAKPQAVTVGGDNPKTAPWQVDYSKLTPLLVKSVQELLGKANGQAEELSTLRAQNAALLDYLCS